MLVQWGCDDRQGIFAWGFKTALTQKVECEQYFKEKIGVSKAISIKINGWKW